MKIVIFGLSITSSLPNAHAATYRGLMRELDARGHDVLFLQRDQARVDPRDLSKPSFGRMALYRSLSEVKRRYTRQVRDAAVVIVGSYVPDGVEIGRWVTRIAKGVKAFYDIDAPVTLSRLQHGDAEYLTRPLIPRFDLYLSFTGGPTLDRLQSEFRSPAARALYCAFDPGVYYPEAVPLRWDLGYMGTYSEDRQSALDKLLVEPARALTKSRFVVAGPGYPLDVPWPKNVQRKAHCAAKQHRRFYSAQRFTLNLTRAHMVEAGYSPSTRLFEAAACGTPIISDAWAGLDKLFKPRREILIARRPKDVIAYLQDMSESERREIGLRARERALADHTAAHRAAQLERYVAEVLTGQLMA